MTELGESFDVRGADTPGDYAYRVVAGPYTKKSLAEDVLSTLHQRGRSDAWLYAEASVTSDANWTAASEPMNAAEGDQTTAASYQSRPGRFDGRYDSGLNRKDNAGNRETTDPAPSSGKRASSPRPSTPVDSELERPDQERVPTLVDEAPGNFNLHRLRRDDKP